MEMKTNLRLLRHHYALSLAELETVSGLSNQYISRAELGQVQPTERLEKRLAAAVETVIAGRERSLSALRKDYQLCKGRLLRPVEGIEHDE